jgi:hypothetical protein
LKRLIQHMHNGIILTLMATIATGTVAASPKENAQGALLRNPARLGFSPGFSSVVGLDGQAPGAGILDELWNKCYDPEEKTFKLDIDLTDEEGLAEFRENANRIFDGFSRLNGRGVAGMALGKAALGVVGSAEGGVSGSIDPIDSEGNISASVKAKGDAKVDAVAALGFPLKGRLAGGIAVKKSLLSQATGYADISTDELAVDPNNYQYGADFKRGEANLLDLGLYYKADKYQLDLVLRDFGTVSWTPVNQWTKPFGSSDVVTAPAKSETEEGNIARLAGGVTLTPTGNISLGCFYDKNVNLELEYRPVKWIFIRSGYISGEVGPGNTSLGAGLKLGFLGLDFNAYFSNGVMIGGSSRLSTEF